MKQFILTIYLLLSVFICNAQFAIKTNLLYDATTTPNIGAEVRVGSKSTVNLVYGLNAWEFASEKHGDRYAKHWVLMPEYRWWTCSPFNGHFIGAHLLGGQMNVANVSLPIPGVFAGGENIVRVVKNHRVQGEFVGVGFTYGYQYIISKHWNLEAELGVGYGHVWYDKFRCGECGKKEFTGQTNYIGFTKLGLSFVYLF